MWSLQNPLFFSRNPIEATLRRFDEACSHLSTATSVEALKVEARTGESVVTCSDGVETAKLSSGLDMLGRYSKFQVWTSVTCRCGPAKPLIGFCRR